MAGGGEEGGFREVRVFRDLLLRPQLLDEIFGLQAQADDVPKLPVGRQTKRQHEADVDPHQQAADMLQRIGGEPAIGEIDGRGRQEEREEGRQIASEGGDGAGGNPLCDQKDEELGIERIVSRQPDRRPAPAGALAKADGGERVAPGPPVRSPRGRSMIGAVQRDVSGGAQSDVQAPTDADVGRQSPEANEQGRQDDRGDRRGDDADAHDGEDRFDFLGADLIGDLSHGGLEMPGLDATTSAVELHGASEGETYRNSTRRPQRSRAGKRRDRMMGRASRQVDGDLHPAIPLTERASGIFICEDVPQQLDRS